MTQRPAHPWLAGSLAPILLSGCFSSAPLRSARAATPPAASSQSPLRTSTVATGTHGMANSAALPAAEESVSDCVFLQNAARAVAEYQAFIVHAGAANEYAGAVQRSQEQIGDLEAEMEFVRSGMQLRGAHCIADVATRTQQSALE
jgi:hypothetical protein